MNAINPGTSSPPEPQKTGETPPLSITPELVRQVADKVYQRLLEDLRIERERSRGVPPNQRHGLHKRRDVNPDTAPSADPWGQRTRTVPVWYPGSYRE
jgi:hypothetical protein